MSCKIYGPRNFIRYFNRQKQRQTVRENLNIADARGGTIIVNTKTHAYGAFDADGVFIPESRQFRNNNHQVVPKFIKDAPYIDADAVFLGAVYPEFGHFLLEHMNRAYALLRPEYKGAKVVFVNNRGLKNIPQYMYDFPRMLGVRKEDVIILDAPARFRRLVVPTQAFNLPYMMSRGLVDVCAAMRDNAPRGKYGDKIYVSRSALQTRRTYNEVAVQKIFAKNGFAVLHPETMSVEEQIIAMKNAKVLAGCAGSALHLSLFMPHGGTVIQLRRNKKKQCNAAMQNMLNAACGHNSIFIAASVEDKPTIHSTFAPQIIGVTEYMKQFFKDMGFKYTDKDIVPDEKEVADYRAANAQWYADHDGAIVMWLKKKIVRISSCFIPGRVLRGRYRRWLRAKFGFEQSKWK